MRIEWVLIAGFLLLFLQGAAAAPCTDGVDCYCDRVSGNGPQGTADALYDPNLAWCEDFETPSLDQDATGTGWVDYFGSPVNGCWDPNWQGSGYSDWRNSVEGTCPTCCVDVVKATTCGVSGETGCVFDGIQSMGKRYRPGQFNGGGGGANFPSGQHFGMAKAVRYSTNYINMNDPKKNDMFGRAQFSGHFLWGASSGTFVSKTDSMPFHYFVFFKNGFTPTYTEVKGHAGISGTPAFGWWADPSDWNWYSDHGVGEWHCWRQHIANIGSSNATIRVWMDNTLLIHLTDVDMRGMDNSVIDRIEWDWYHNGAYSAGSSPAYIYEDNMHISLGNEAPTCESLGFNFGPPVCGDGSCNGTETFSSCPADCPAPPQCGDGICNGNETASTCAQDCPTPPMCGDGTCNGTETCSSCSADCGACAICGDGTCNGSETCSTCSQDCGSCSLCGNGTINSGEECDGSNLGGATCVSLGFDGGSLSCSSSCEFDANGCTATPQCGDGTCNGTETCSSCSADCGSCPPPSGGVGLVAHWKFDESGGNTVFDSSGNGNNGTLTGPSRVLGLYGNALDFDGTNDYVNVPSSSSLQLGSEITLAAWINPGNQTAQNRIVHKRQGDSRNAYALMISNNERIHFRGSNCSDYFQDFPNSGTASVVPINTWSHVAATFSDAGNTVKIYVNGQEVASSNTFTISPCATNTEPLQIGGHTGTPRWFDGAIEDVYIYDRVLSAAEIATLIAGLPLNPGDLNGDLVVDVFDLVIIGRNFNLTTGFDAAADANGDGRVDITDLAVVSSNFGKIY